MLLLSLVKYSPADLQGLAKLPILGGFLEPIADKSGAPGENLIGPVGGILGFLQILLFGAASYLVPVGFIWFGIVKLAFDARIWPRAVMGFCILLLAGRRLAGCGEDLFRGMGRAVAARTAPAASSATASADSSSPMSSAGPARSFSPAGSIWSR